MFVMGQFVASSERFGDATGQVFVVGNTLPATPKGWLRPFSAVPTLRAGKSPIRTPGRGSVDWGHGKWRAEETKQREVYMLTTIAVILLVLWLLGLVSSYTLSGFIHVLLVVALVMLIISFVSGRRSL